MDKTIIKECPKHGLTEHVLQTNGSYKCKECRKDAVIDIRRRNKIKLVEYKGGKCERCGYDKCIDALEFHHLNPDEKDFGLSCGDTRSLEKLKAEADKCIMVCANCHREIHAEERERKILERDKKKNENEAIFKAKKKNENVKIKSKKIILNIEEIKNDITNRIKKVDIAKKYSIGLTTLKRFLRKNGITYIESRSNGKLKDLTKENFLASFKELKSFTATSKKFNVSDKALQKWCYRNNLPWRKKDLVEYINNL